MVPRLQRAGFVWRQNENINLVRSLHSRTVQCHDRRAATAEHHPTANSVDTTRGAAAFDHTAIPGARSDNGAGKVTITGCLQAAPEVPTGTAGTSGSSASAAALEKFMLIECQRNVGGGSGSASASDARTYRLVANESALAPHAGKKIEVTGTLDTPSASASPNSAPSGSSSSSTNMPKLVVESGKVISQSCAN